MKGLLVHLACLVLLVSNEATGADFSAAVQQILSATPGDEAIVGRLVDLGPQAVEPLLVAIGEGPPAHRPDVAAALEGLVRAHRPVSACRPNGRPLAQVLTPAPFLAVAQDPEQATPARALAVQLLGRLGDPRAVEPLGKLIRDPQLAGDVVRALGAIGDVAALPLLSELQRDPNVDLRSAAARATTGLLICAAPGSSGYAEIAALLGRFATSDAEEGIRRYALQTLAGVDYPGLDTVLVNAVADRSAQCRAMAADAILARAARLERAGAREPARHLLESAFSAAQSFHDARPFAERLNPPGAAAGLLLPRFRTIVVDVGAPAEDLPFLGPGWSDEVRDASGAFRWSIAHEAQLRVPALPGYAVAVEMLVSATRQQILELAWNNQRLPGEAIQDGELRLIRSLTAEEVGNATETVFSILQNWLDESGPQTPGGEPFHRGVQLRELVIRLGS